MVVALASKSCLVALLFATGNQWLEDDFFWGGGKRLVFQGFFLLISGRGNLIHIKIIV